ncbi:MAG: tripartite tricarboxylate transporter substrate binding protein [Alphaproteobacteria bacterium]|nr:tripartite tricarboxylate transporter substrate binding protein [Alphaproteobacteria bacterium]
MTTRAMAGLVVVLAAAWALPASAQSDAAKDYPTKPMHMIVGFAAGGGNDVIARIVGQQIVVENKPGAGAIIATEIVARAPADGYTILVGATGAMTVNPAVYAKLSYDTLRDFAPISTMAAFPLILVVQSSSPIHSVADLVAYAKANPSKANYGAPSASFQLVDELFKMKTGIPAEYVAYKGSNEAATAVMSGEVLMQISDPGPVAGLIKGGKLRGLAVTAEKRMSDFPDIPTMSEAGVHDMNVSFWSGLFVPAATPPAIVTKLHDTTVRALQAPDVQEHLKALALDVVSSTPAEYRQAIAKEITQWTEVAKKADIHLTQ